MSATPEATRPWQFVLDALHGYLLAAERAFEGDVPDAFNFGRIRAARAPFAGWPTPWPRDGAAQSWTRIGGAHPYEASTLALDSYACAADLGWKPISMPKPPWPGPTDWYKSARVLTREQIERFMEIFPRDLPFCSAPLSEIVRRPRRAAAVERVRASRPPARAGTVLSARGVRLRALFSRAGGGGRIAGTPFSDYAYFSSYSDAWLAHARDYSIAIRERLAQHEIAGDRDRQQ